MRYIDFILSLNNIINLYLPGENGGRLLYDIDKVQDIVNNSIITNIKTGIILPFNKPNISVFLDKYANKYVCVPMDIFTTYMSENVDYNLTHPQHYEKYNLLINSDKHFHTEMEYILNRNIRKYTLRSQSISNIDDNFYLDIVGVKNYNDKIYNDVVEVLDYEYNIFKPSNDDFKEFQQFVYKMIKRVDMIHKLSSGKFDANDAWVRLFTKIRNTGLSFYGSQCRHDSFLNLQYRYTNIQSNRKDNTESKPQTSNTDNTLLDMLKFMQLPTNYTLKQLKKRFRKLAIEYHPDKRNGDSAKFIKLKTYYDCLIENLK